MGGCVGVDDKGGEAKERERLDNRAKIQRAYRESHPEKTELYNRRGRRRSKKRRIAFRKMTDAYKSSRGCTDCGIANPIVLDFDHIGKKLFDIGNGVGRNPHVLADEVAKCVVRCANCHRIKTHERRRVSEKAWQGTERRRRIQAVSSARSADNSREDFLKFYFQFWATPDA